MRIFLGADHAGFELKEHIKTYLMDKGYEIEDCGAHEYNPDDDYPDFIEQAALGVSKTSDSMGIVIGGSGQAEAMAANKEIGVRCALFYAPAVAVTSVDVNGRESKDAFEIVKLARDHNDANMLSLSARFLDQASAEYAVELFLNTPFSNEERHKRRIEKLARLENV